MSVGSHFRAPLTTKLLNGTKVPLTDSNGNLIAQILTSLASGSFSRGPQYVAAVAIPNATTKTLHSAPVLLVAAPGAGSWIEVDSIYLNYLYGTTQFTGGGVIQGAFGSAGSNAATGNVAATFLTGPTANQVVSLGGSIGSLLSSAVLNQGLYLAAATADFAAGDGSLVALVTYRIVTGIS